MHRKTQTPVDITFMCPSIRRDGAIKNTCLLCSYAENDTEIREAFNFVKFLQGHKPIFSARTQGFSSYTWAILMIQYVIKIRRIYIDPSDYEVFTGKSKARSRLSSRVCCVYFSFKEYILLLFVFDVLKVFIVTNHITSCSTAHYFHIK